MIPSRKITRLVLVFGVVALLWMLAGLLGRPLVQHSLSARSADNEAQPLSSWATRSDSDVDQSGGNQISATLVRDAGAADAAHGVQRPPGEAARSARRPVIVAPTIDPSDPFGALTFAAHWARIYRPTAETALAAGNNPLDFYSWQRATVQGSEALVCGVPGQETALLRYWLGGSGIACVDIRALCMAFDGTKIAFTRQGGERLEDVAGQDESVEYPVFSPGWLGIHVYPPGRVCDASRIDRRGLPADKLGLPDHLPRTAAAVAMKPLTSCGGSDASTPLLPLVLFVMRYEYVNLYHTMTDWFNAVDALELAVVQNGRIFPSAPVQVIFLDAHPAGSLDDAWATLFGIRPLYLSEAVKQNVRAQQAIFVSPGYRSPITRAMNDLPPTKLVVSSTMERFRSFFLIRHGFTLAHDQDAMLMADQAVALEASAGYPHSGVVDGTSDHIPGSPRAWITVVFRGDYKPHPRHSGRTTRKIVNERELLEALARRAGELPLLGDRRWGVRGVHLEHLGLRQQIAVFRSSQVVVGVHGAALSLVLFMQPETSLVELQPSGYQVRRHFQPMATSVKVRHIAVPMPSALGDGPYSVDAEAVAAAVFEAREAGPVR